ncbi:MAG: hypothetical protein JSV44_07540 [Candidatus Zixiibacteriota bacterium]|nr:MAG: hypothetical protein JSV44_07540 [candidate division Zixibacteria bacterium]
MRLTGVETNADISERPDLNWIWPYLFFTLAVTGYNAFFLKYGFNATDEGWLLSLGNRIADGEQPYRDFYFLITPLSIYIQAALIRVFGDNYTVLASRIYWTVQMYILSVAASTLYRKYVNRMELLFLLLTTYVISSMLISFPWYSYDGVFWGTLAVICFYRKRYIPVGMAAFLAFLSKQNYIVLLPLFLAFCYFVRLLRIETRQVDARSVGKMAIGFCVPALAYLLYLTVAGTLGHFIKNVMVYPPETSNMSIWFALFQNNFSVLPIALPMLALAILLFFCRSKIWLLGLIVLIPLTLYMIIPKVAYFIFSIAFLNYTVLLLVLLRLKGKDEQIDRDFVLGFLPTQLFAITVLYLAGNTFVGITFTYACSGVVLPLSYLMFKKLSPSPYRVQAAVLLFIAILAVGSYQKFNYIYRDAGRPDLIAKFTSGKLRGIRSTPRNVGQIEGLIEATRANTDRGDFILVFPDFPVLYYLTERKNPTPVDWYYWRGINKEIMVDAIQALAKNMPEVVFIQKYAEEDFKRKSSPIPYIGNSKHALLFSFVASEYDLAGQVGDVFMLTPRP